jgi:hypothetical protein
VCVKCRFVTQLASFLLPVFVIVTTCTLSNVSVH